MQMEKGMEPFSPDIGTDLIDHERSWISYTDQRLVKINQKVASVGVVIMLLIGMLNLVDIVVFRWLLNRPIAGSNEVFATAFGVAVASVLASGLSSRASLEIDLLSSWIPKRMEAMLRAIGATVFLAVIIVMLVAVARQAMSAYNRGTITSILQLKLWPFYIAITFFFAFCVPSQMLVALDRMRNVGREKLLSTLFVSLAILATIFLILWTFSYPSPAFVRQPMAVAGVIVLLLWAGILLYLPLAAALMLAAMGGIAVTFGPKAAINIAGSETIGLFTSAELATLPFFLLMGGFAIASGMASDIYRFAHAVFAPFRGGLTLGTVGGSAGFGALTGSSIATIVTIGSTAYPEMKKRGYDPSFAAATISAGGTLGQLIPPSTVVVIYAILVEESIGALYMAILLPALLTVVMYFSTIMLLVRLRPGLAPAGQPWNVREVLDAGKGAFPAFVLFATVLGGVFFGIMTATESAALGTVFAFLVALRRGKLAHGAFWSVAAETTKSTSMIYFLIAGALVTTFYFGSSGATQTLTGYIMSLQLPPWSILVALLIFYIILGTIMDGVTVMMITASTSVGIIHSLGYDPIWWGVIMVIVVELGMLTPPFGMNLFVMKAAAPDLTMRQLYRGILPFVVSDMFKLVILVAFPAITLWLPSMMR